MLHADNETNKWNEDNMLENSFMTCRLRETVLPPGMKIDLSKGTKSIFRKEQKMGLESAEMSASEGLLRCGNSFRRANSFAV